MKLAMTMIRLTVVAAIITLLTGCGAGQKNVKLSRDFWQDRQQKVVVAICKTPEPQLYQTGDQGLIGYAISSVVNNDMNKALKQTDLSWYNNIAANFAKQLKDQNIKVAVHSAPINADKKIEQSVIAQADGDKLLVIELKALGARRDYVSFIPTGAPKAYCVLSGKLIDPRDPKKVLWRHETEVILPVEGAWDQKPTYPNLTRAVQMATNEAREELLGSFFSGR